MEARGKLAALLDEDRKDARRRGEGGRDVDFATSQQVSSLSTTQQAVEGRVAKLEGELESLRALIKSAGIMPAAGGVAGRGH